jgi:undecaprenyl-diphosphatase
MLGDLRVMGLLSLVVGLWLLWRRQGLQLLSWVVAVAGTGLWVRFIKATMQRASAGRAGA